MRWLVLALALVVGADDARADEWSTASVYVGVNLFDLTLPLLGEFGDIGPALRPIVGAAWTYDDVRVWIGGDVELTELGSDVDRLTINAGGGWKTFSLGGGWTLTDHVGLDGALHITGALGTSVTAVEHD